MTNSVVKRNMNFNYSNGSFKFNVRSARVIFRFEINSNKKKNRLRFENLELGYIAWWLRN